MENVKFSSEQRVAASQFIREKKYWMNQLEGELEKSIFPYDYKKTGLEERCIDEIKFNLNKRLSLRMMELSNGSDPKLHMILVSGLVALVTKYTGSEDILVGTPIDKQEIEGNLVNTIIPLRILLGDSMTFKALLLEVKRTINEAIENQNYPIETLMYEMDMILGGNEFSPFELSIILENIQDKKYLQHTNCNVSFSFNRKGEALEGIVEYNTLLYQKNTIEKIIDRYIILLHQVLFNIDLPIGEIDLLCEEERKHLIDFNNTDAPYPNHKTIHELFEQQAKKRPFKKALIYGDDALTYWELNERASQLAKVLRDRGIRIGSVVGILLERSFEMIIAIIGVLKAGGAYLPIDIDYPTDRKKYILEDSDTAVLLTRKRLSENLDWNGEIIDVEEPNLYIDHIQDFDHMVKSSDLAYIIYTSGSTGKPKGVMVEHLGVVNYIYWAAKMYVKDKEVNFPLYSSVSFDLTVTSIFTPLVTGNAIVIYEDFYMDKIIKDNLVGVIKLTPSHLRVIRMANSNDLTPVFGQTSTNIKRFIVGGEELDTQLARDIHDIFSGEIEIYNEYGPTEATVGCMIYQFNREYDRRNTVPIGKSADNVQIYILDKSKKPVFPGAVGMLYVSGDGLARGYLKRLTLTEKKFVPNPFKPGEKMYETGDLARFLPDGNIEFLGRKDQQVKIRGYRIELAEIESHLLKIDGIKNALVIPKDDEKGNRYLVAYWVYASKEKEITVSKIRESLSGELPDYMIPSYYVSLDSIPLTPNGKVDKIALPEYSESINTGVEYKPPRNEIEEILVKVWQDVLGVEKIGIDDEYFALGGDSIKVIQIASRVQKFGLKLEVKDLFSFSTIGELSAFIKPIKQSVDQGVVEGEVMLTPSQKWFFEKNFSDMHYFNMTVMLHQSERFKKELVKKAFQKLVSHHDALRMVFKVEEGVWRQFNRGISDNLVELKVFDICGEESYKKIIKEKSNAIQSSIDLTQGSLVRLGLFKTKNGDYLLITIHHLVMDGVSLRIILEDFALTYTQMEMGVDIDLPPKTNSFKEWAEKLKDYANSETFLEELSYWIKLEDNQIQPLPVNRLEKRPKLKDSKKATLELTPEYTKKLLTGVNKAYNTEINDILLAALGMAFKDWIGLKKILINLEGHGREDIIEGLDISRTVGFFTSQFPVILNMENTDDISIVIKNSKEMLRHIPNKGMGYGILKYLTGKENKQDFTGNTKPEISFNYLGQLDRNRKIDLLRLAKIDYGNAISPNIEREYLLDILGVISDERLQISVIYAGEEFKKEKMDLFVNYYKKNLELVIDHCVEKEETELTLSDYSSSDLNEGEVDSIFDELEDSLGKN